MRLCHDIIVDSTVARSARRLLTGLLASGGMGPLVAQAKERQDGKGSQLRLVVSDNLSGRGLAQFHVQLECNEVNTNHDE